jgi:hypothetical protein
MNEACVFWVQLLTAAKRNWLFCISNENLFLHLRCGFQKKVFSSKAPTSFSRGPLWASSKQRYD